MLNHKTCLRSRGNTQVQGRHKRKAAPGTQGMLSMCLSGDTPHSDHLVTLRPDRSDQDEKRSLSSSRPPPLGRSLRSRRMRSATPTPDQPQTWRPLARILAPDRKDRARARNPRPNPVTTYQTLGVTPLGPDRAAVRAPAHTLAAVLGSTPRPACIQPGFQSLPG